MSYICFFIAHMNKSKWNWQLDLWPNFSWDAQEIDTLEKKFLLNSGKLIGACSHFDSDQKMSFTIETIENEAFKTSEIEGEFLDRESLQSSIKRNFGLASRKKSHPAESGIAEMMVDLHKNFHIPISDDLMHAWHGMLMNGRRDLNDIGSYRTHADAMQIISGPIGAEKVHFEAPPSRIVPREMQHFIHWFNKTDAQKLPPLTRASIAHLCFVCIHPFEDGNGRLARAISEKSLLQSLGAPIFITLSQTIQRNKKDYYRNLEISNKTCDLTSWILYFAKTILRAQSDTSKLVDFIIKKAKFYDKNKSKLNERQNKVIKRILDEGIYGFKGGLSANNYTSITKISASTATRDLQDLINKKILKHTGTNKSRRYHLNL